jgi:glucose 1-dehydrogenase
MHELSGHWPHLSIALHRRRDDDAAPRRKAGMSQAQGNWLGLTGRVCAVTGAASGIGLATAQALAMAGAAVAVIDRDATGAADVARVIAADHGVPTVGVGCDVADETAVRAAALHVREALGPVHGLVNNAGFLRAGSLEDGSLDDWNAVLAANLTGQWLCAREFGRDMLHAGRGAIVNVASISAMFPQTRSGAYSASKAGVLLLTRQLAAEWGPRGVRCNAVCPGMIRTALSAKFYEVPGFEAARAAVTASRRVGEPQDIAEPVLYLLSDRAAYVNGTELLVDGGLQCMLMDMVPRPGFNQTTTPTNNAPKGRS